MGKKWVKVVKTSEERRKRLAKIVNALRKVGFIFNVDSLDKRLKLQKYVFLLRKYGIDLGYSYDAYVAGPYSTALANDYRHLPFTKEKEELPEKFVKLVKYKNSRWLEVASSLVMVFERYPDVDEKEAIEIVSDYKSVEPKYVEGVLRRLKRYDAI